MARCLSIIIGAVSPPFQGTKRVVALGNGFGQRYISRLDSKQEKTEVLVVGAAVAFVAQLRQPLLLCIPFAIVLVLFELTLFLASTSAPRSINIVAMSK
jgi:hypothetical protein